MNNASKFIELYTSLETIVHNLYSDLPDSGWISYLTKKYLPDEKKFLSNCQNLRNTLVHYNTSNIGEYFAEPSDFVINKLEDIIEELKRPKLVKDIYTPLSKIYFAKIDDYVLPKIKELIDKGYSHLPILDNNNHVIGMFNDNVISSALVNNKSITIDENTKFTNKLIYEYCNFNKYQSWKYEFISCFDSVKKVKSKFENIYDSKTKVLMLLVTKNGLVNEPLEGIVTPWDILGYKGE